MPGKSKNTQPASESIADPHAWALEKIAEAKRRKRNTLDLSGGNLSKIPDEVFEFSDLTSLRLSHNQLSSIPESITRLQNLTNLDLNGNLFSRFPESITRLPNLATLDLGNNQLSALPESIKDLRSLITLYLIGNSLNTLPDSITDLDNLSALHLSENRFTTIPESITRLPNLKNLYLRGNQLSEIPRSIIRMEGLKALSLSNNKLKMIPGSIIRLQNLNFLELNGNPLVSPPIEIAQKGIEAIREYFRQLDEEGVDYFYEAKLLILGEGEAGKTTLVKKINNSAYQLQNEGSTQGVDVSKWSFPFDHDKSFRVNIWDFGGQEIYHATHQFFLTRHSLYLLVADTRKEDTDFYYWLNVAELLSENSPLLIVKNEKEDRERQINEKQLKGQFEVLKEVLATNLATNRGLEEVKEQIKHYIRKLPHVGSPLPRTWVHVREQLETDRRNYVSLDEFNTICKENGVSESDDRRQVSEYLHDIGVILHFHKEPLLKRIVILNPKWGTDAVYKVLDNPKVKRNLGQFSRADLESIWKEEEYEDMRDELLQLMMKFKVCYEIPNEKGAYIAPHLLTEDQPDYEWDPQDNLLLRYSYEFMPKGILTQFIVVMHPYIREQRIVWKSGVVIEQDATRAEVIEYYGKREIHVRVAGPQARDLLTVIRRELKTIHDTYKRLKYDELVHCNCSACRDSQEPHFYAVAKLLEFRANGQLEIQCQKKPYEMVNVLKLLGDTIDLGKLSEQNQGPVFKIEHYYERGDNKMTENKISIKDSTIHGSVVAAESIQDSFNTIQNSKANDDLKDTLTQLTKAVEAMIKDLPKEKAEQAEETADYMKRLSEEATKQKPNPKWYNVSIEGLIAAAQNLGKVGDAVIELSGKVRKILTGGLL